MSGLDWLPAAVKDPRGKPLTWAETTNPKGVLHTTEGSSWPSYAGWTVHPHATIKPTPGVGVEIRQHVPFSRASFALVHSRAQDTNRDFAFQFELIGTCTKGGPGCYWPDADDAVLTDLYRKVIEPLSTAYGIPLTAPTWLPYPASYGATGVRLSDARWDTYRGWLGHQHVPQNDHGDPGAFPWARLLAAKPKPPTPPTPPGDDMALSDADVKRIAQAVWGSEYGPTTARVTTLQAVSDARRDAAAALAAVTALQAKVDAEDPTPPAH